MYPLALGVNSEESEFSLIYGMPDLPQATGQEKQEESGSEAVLSITGSDFYEIERIYDRSQEKYLDMSHLQVIIMGDRLLEGEGWKIFMEYLKEEPFVGENVYISGQKTRKQCYHGKAEEPLRENILPGFWKTVCRPSRKTG